jgi:Trypsin-like peptidase domain
MPRVERMQMTSPPLHGWLWNEAELPKGDPLHESLAILLVVPADAPIVPIGTIFIVLPEGNRATAISAAHNFDAVQRVLHPHSSHHETTPPEFRRPEELDLKQLKAMYTKANQIYVCAIEMSIWDSASDLAVLTILAPDGYETLFTSLVLFDDSVPSVGETVAMIGYGRMEVITPDETRPHDGTLKRQLVLRVGMVEGVYSHGYAMLRAPCIVTTIQVHGGMSGGIVARFGSPETPIQPFAFICHSPKLETHTIDNRSVSGHSVGVIIQMKRTLLADKKQHIEIAVNNIKVGRIKS